MIYENTAVETTENFSFHPMEMFLLCFLDIPLLATYPNVSRLSRTDVAVSHVNDLVSFDPQPSSSESICCFCKNK
jgi:hypothetical protein